MTNESDIVRLVAVLWFNPGLGILGLASRARDLGLGIQVLVSRVWHLGLKIQGSGSWVWHPRLGNPGFGIHSLGSWVWHPRFGILGLKKSEKFFQNSTSTTSKHNVY